MKVIKTIGALVAFAVGVSSAWAASTPDEWNKLTGSKKPAASNDVLQVTGAYDIPLAVDEEVSTAYGVYFNINTGSKVTKLTASGLPAGVTLDTAKAALKGKPTKEKVYVAKITAENENKFKFTHVVKFTVGNPEVPEYTDELGISANFTGQPTIGDVLDSDDSQPWQIIRSFKDSADNSSVTETFSISGLPAGLKSYADKESDKIGTESGTKTTYEAFGAYTTPGVYVVKAKKTTTDKASGEKPYTETASSMVEVLVEGGESRYVDVQVAKGKGKVSKGGVIDAGKTIKLTATADKGYVFAGWYQDKACTIEAPYNSYHVNVLNKSGRFVIDNQTIVNGRFYSEDADIWYSSLPLGNPATFYARFIEKSNDTGVAIEATLKSDGPDGNTPFAAADLDGYEFSIDPNYMTQWDLDFRAWTFLTDSSTGSYAKVISVKGLPACVVQDKWSGEVDEIHYNPTKTVLPGVYDVTVSAKNASGAMKSIVFTIKIENFYSGLISVDDSYNIPINVEETILVSAAEGYNLTVAGLPAGMKYNAKDGTISGAPKKAGRYTVKLTAKKAGEPTEYATTTINVEDDLVVEPIWPEGYVYDGEECEVEGIILSIDSPNSKSEIVKIDGLNKGGLKGVTFDKKAQKITGKASAAGKYVLTATVKNTSNPNKQVKFTFIVPNTDLISATIDSVPVGAEEVDSLAYYYAGYDATNLVGSSQVYVSLADASYTLSYTGLPSGLKVDKSSGLISGKPTIKGKGNVETNDVVFYAKAKKGNATGSLAMKIIVTKPEVKVLAENSVWNSTNTTDKVSGAGYYNYGTTVNLTATPKGSLFVGWYDADKSLITTKTAYSFKFTNVVGKTFIAKFATKDESVFDVKPLPEYKADFFTNWTTIVDTIYALPTAKVEVAGLPNGLKCYTNVVYSTGDVVMPGSYDAKVTASVKKDSTTFKTNFTWSFTVPNGNAFLAWADATPVTVTNHFGFATNIATFVEEAYTNTQIYTISVSGLPSGMKYNGLDGTNVVVSGIPSATAKKYPIYFTVTSNATKKVVSSALVYQELLGMPEWLVGTYNGLTETDYGTNTLIATEGGCVSSLSVKKDGKATLSQTWLDIDTEKLTKANSDFVKGLAIAWANFDADGTINQVIYTNITAVCAVTGGVDRVVSYTNDEGVVVYYGDAWFDMFDIANTNFYESSFAQELYSRKAPMVTNLVNYTTSTNIIVDVSSWIGPKATLMLRFSKNGLVTPNFKYVANVDGRDVTVTGVYAASPVVYTDAEKGEVYVLLYRKDTKAEVMLVIPVTKNGVNTSGIAQLY